MLLVPVDETLRQHLHKLQDRRQDVLLEIASLKRQREMPTDILKPQHINVISTALRSGLLDRSSRFGKDYLKLLVNEIKIEGNEAHISGSYDAPAYAIAETEKGAPQRVPTFLSNWLIKSDESGNWNSIVFIDC